MTHHNDEYKTWPVSYGEIILVNVNFVEYKHL